MIVLPPAMSDGPRRRHFANMIAVQIMNRLYRVESQEIADNIVQFEDVDLISGEERLVGWR
jgi:hypothetical protein